MKILVVGAGIAGSGVALMLTHDGHDVRVVDAITEPYRGGYQILFDRTAMRMVQRIGVLPEIEALSTPTATITVTRKGKDLARMRTDGYRSARRGDLVATIARHAERRVPFQYGVELVGIEHTLTGVVARFADGSAEKFDLIIGADGLSSTVRRLAVEDGRSAIYENGRHHLWVNVPGRMAGTTEAAILLGDRAGAQVFPYTDHDETLVLTSINLGRGRQHGPDLLPIAAELLATASDRFAPFVDQVRTAAPDRIRVTKFAQVRAPRWHARNVVLIGDAAHCIDPLSGAGAHGGLVGGAIFADELRRTPDNIAAAALRYRRRLLPFVRSAQLLTAGVVERATAGNLRQRFTADRSLIGAALAVRRADVPRRSFTTAALAASRSVPAPTN
ncbi:2-polyprenyl-6-methoxyphenol hydroxylase [Curtobacterium sp. 314Chir4.1]|uniref:FAD-dependent oxidoreductase n=1 Tax=Curtobacterium sp. 314Chir4.1 TaxID=1279028 RepID=UPI000BC37775|nr:NAD(P)/FAD-dependent oxidoreductase [Curtobacterium sp. 314Chir4.1]SOC89645.1 2-polyprenyl-6-methoxyphenol hydroxylase [Curtobacterium sp. 314Chir4.1]